jgi:cytochrome P450 family 4
MARDPEIFKDPLEFIPERFDVETTADRVNPYAYIPFSAGEILEIFKILRNKFSTFHSTLGSRNCIGQKFAMLEMKSTVSKVLRHFKLSLVGNFEPEDSLELVIKSRNGVMIKLENRIY